MTSWIEIGASEFSGIALGSLKTVSSMNLDTFTVTDEAVLDGFGVEEAGGLSFALGTLPDGTVTLPHLRHAGAISFRYGTAQALRMPVLETLGSLYLYEAN